MPSRRSKKERAESIVVLFDGFAGDFCFNREKRYLGVISDEMGFYKPRDKK